MIVSAVPTEYVANIWPDVAPMIDKAMELTSVLEANDILEDIFSKKTALWVIVDEDDGDKIVAVATTRLVNYPKGLALAIDWLGGEKMSEWLPQLDEVLEKYAKDHNCIHIEGYGRDGWLRALKPYGYEKWYPTYKKDIRYE